MSGISFLNNAAVEDGGIFYIYSQLAAPPTASPPLFDIQISSSTFTNSFAENNGGSFYVESPAMRNIQVTDVDFINTKAISNGGGFFIQDMNGKLSFLSSVHLSNKFEDFNALKQGSFLYSLPATFEFSIKNYLV
jgi:hypothetical protein